MDTNEVAQGISAERWIQEAAAAGVPFGGSSTAGITWTGQHLRVCQLIGNPGKMQPGILRQRMIGGAAVCAEDSPWDLVLAGAAPKLHGNSDLAQVVHADQPLRARFVIGEGRQRQQSEERQYR